MIEVYAQSFDEVWFGVACSHGQIVASSFGPNQQTTINNILCNLPFNVPFQVFLEPSVFAKTALEMMESIYDGLNTNANFPLTLSRLPAYTQKVLKATAQIPVGYVTFYGLIAKAVGGGPRAVGNVMANNPFAPIVPCHRVVRTDFTLGGYGMGLKAKVMILSREKRGFSDTKRLNLNGEGLEIYPVEYVLRKLA